MISRDAFMSYAGEDTPTAKTIVSGLETRGFNIWYAPVDLKIGQKLLDSVEEGMNSSRSGILLISKAYLVKGWTNYEMDTLIRQSIEGEKNLFPIWDKVTKEEVSNRHAGLAGIVALRTDEGLQQIIDKLTGAMSSYAPTIGVIPIYESPKWRFLQGRGEINLGSQDGPATTIWELLLHNKDSKYPIYLDGELFSKEDLLLQAAQLLPHIPDVVDNWIRKEGREKLWEMCKEAGIDPKIFE